LVQAASCLKISDDGHPEVLLATMETGGENLLKGLKNLVQDLERVGDNSRLATFSLRYTAGLLKGSTRGI
jgi:Poly(3-hydroxyalkanoate) synthetase